MARIPCTCDYCVASDKMFEAIDEFVKVAMNSAKGNRFADEKKYSEGERHACLVTNGLGTVASRVGYLVAKVDAQYATAAFNAVGQAFADGAADYFTEMGLDVYRDDYGNLMADTMSTSRPN